MAEPSALDEKSSVTQHEIGENGRDVMHHATNAPGITRANFAHIDEKKLLRRMDWHLLPSLTALYLLSFIDRGNIVGSNDCDGKKK